MQYHNLGVCVEEGIGIHLIIVVYFFYAITKWSCKKNGLIALTIFANISQMELNKANSVAILMNF